MLKKKTFFSAVNFYYTSEGGKLENFKPPGYAHAFQSSIVISPSFPLTRHVIEIMVTRPISALKPCVKKIIINVVQTHSLYQWNIFWMMFGNPGNPACPGQPPDPPSPLYPSPPALPSAPPYPAHRPRHALAAHVHQIKTQRTFCSEVYIAIISRGAFCRRVICFCRTLNVKQTLYSLDQLLIKMKSLGI